MLILLFFICFFLSFFTHFFLPKCNMYYCTLFGWRMSNVSKVYLYWQYKYHLPCHFLLSTISWETGKLQKLCWLVTWAYFLYTSIKYLHQLSSLALRPSFRKQRTLGFLEISARNKPFSALIEIKDNRCIFHIYVKNVLRIETNAAGSTSKFEDSSDRNKTVKNK